MKFMNFLCELVCQHNKQKFNPNDLIQKIYDPNDFPRQIGPDRGKDQRYFNNIAKRNNQLYLNRNFSCPQVGKKYITQCGKIAHITKVIQYMAPYGYEMYFEGYVEEYFNPSGSKLEIVNWNCAGLRHTYGNCVIHSLDLITELNSEQEQKDVG